ncbi:MAG: tRNA lysidine(34) synthetase TilS [Flavobacteriales bacterium]
MPLNLQEFERRLSTLFSGSEKVIVALSGGLDSVVLTHLLKEMGVNVVLAHMNFQLRGEESEGDEEFVKKLAKSWKLPLVVERADTQVLRKQKKKGVQEFARQLRYDWLEKLRRQHEASYILTAHHADDQVETMVFHFLRGSGIKGLAGMPQKENRVLRPLLSFSREEIDVYARRMELKWREDSSNSTTKYTRNAIRHRTIPELEKLNPGFKDTLLHLAPIYRETASLVREHVDTEIKKNVRWEGEEQTISIEWLRNSDHPRLFLWEWLRPFGFGSMQVAEVIDLMSRPTGSRVKGGIFEVLRNRDVLVLCRVHDTAIAPDQIERGQFEWTGQYSIRIEEIPLEEWELDKSPAIAQLDADLLEFPLTIRPWQEGDRFKPLGMKGSQKISDFLIQQKIALNQKSNILVLVSGEKIVWVVGYRIAADAAVSATTKWVWKAHLS